jgi:alginate O-acetyltransferase complex protein AlgI
MIFSQIEFIFVFLPVVILISFILPRSFLTAWLALASLFFYGWSAEQSSIAWYLCVPFLFFIVINYLFGEAIERSSTTSRQRFILWTGILMDVGWWFLLKLQWLSGLTSFLETIVSIGLGFYVLRAIGYLIDIYHQRVPPASNLQTFTLYLAFFSHIPSGPITSWKWFSDHLNYRLRSRNPSEWWTGFFLFSMGILKKAIADTIGTQVDPLINAEGSLGFTASWLILMGYSMQIYLDFSGYTDMALGIGRLIGIQLPPNFDKPYLKRNLIEFWNAWHITLSHWLRDYIFTPLGRVFFSIGPLRRSPLAIASLCYIITFAVCGIWHGLEATFLLWGIYHGVGLSCCKFYGELTRKHFSLAYFNFMFKTRIGYVWP